MNPLLEKLFSYTHRKGKDLTFVKELDERLKHPHRSYKTIHVGGTNGKGSVSLKIAAALEEEGFRVGLYTSPHIYNVRERIQINRSLISEKAFLRLLEPLLKISLPLGYFDIITALGFLYFQEEKVDWAVIEVGLGGKHDATNVIYPEIAVITSIGEDHMPLLGNSLEEIAEQKGGIAKPKIPLVVGPTAAKFFPKTALAAKPALFYDLENQNIAKLVLETLSISQRSIEKGLAMRPPCRFERRGNVILDAAHNPDGFKKLIEALLIHFPSGEKFHFIVAFSKDKNWKACLDLIAPLASSITAVYTQKERLEDPKILQKYLPTIAISDSVGNAIKNDTINVVSGSFYLMDY